LSVSTVFIGSSAGGVGGLEGISGCLVSLLCRIAESPNSVRHLGNPPACHRSIPLTRDVVDDELGVASCCYRVKACIFGNFQRSNEGSVLGLIVGYLPDRVTTLGVPLFSFNGTADCGRTRIQLITLAQFLQRSAGAKSE